MITTARDVAPPRGSTCHRALDAGRARRRVMATVATTTPRSAPSCRPQSFTVRRADLVRYAGASGDFNVIHWNDRVAHVRRPARRDRPRHVHDGAGRPGRHRLGRRPGRSSSTASASPGRCRSPTTTRAPRSTSPASVAAKLDGAGCGSTSPPPHAGQKVLGRAQAVVQLSRGSTGRQAVRRRARR